MDSGAPSSFLINSTVLSLRFALLTTPNSFLTDIRTSSFRSFLSQSRRSSGRGLSFLPPSLQACPASSPGAHGHPVGAQVVLGCCILGRAPASATALL